MLNLMIKAHSGKGYYESLVRYDIETAKEYIMNITRFDTRWLRKAELDVDIKKSSVVSYCLTQNIEKDNDINLK